MHLSENASALLSESGWLEGLVREHHVQGCGIAVIREGSLILHRTCGIQSENGEMVEEDTLFECASLTKTLFAALAMKLLQQGFFSLDEPVVAQGGPVWSDDPGFSRITPRHCLTHSSGLPNWDDTPLPLLFNPGERFSYSGEGFFLLQRMIEARTGMTLDALMEQHFFHPLSMHPASVCWTPWIGAHFSKGFDREGRVCKTRDRRRTSGHAPEPNAAWSLYATAASYAAFLCALLKGNAGICPEMMEEMFSPQIQAGYGIAWGLGFGLSEEKPDLFWHWGDNAGFESLMVCDRKTGDGIVVLTNTDEGLMLCEDLVKHLTDLDAEKLLHAFITGAE